MAETYDLSTPAGRVRLLLNDVSSPFVFNDGEITTFLDIEGGTVKLAAALAIETNADSVLLASRVLSTQDVKVDGAKTADALRARAADLRRQVAAEFDPEDDGFFELSPAVCRRPELTERLF